MTQSENDPYPILYEPIVKTREDKITIGRGTRIDSFVKLEGGQGLSIGRYVHIASFCHVGMGGGTTIIEDYCNLSSGAKIISGTNLIDFLSISVVAPDNMMKVRPMLTVLKKYAAVFTNGVVLPGVTLHEGAVLGAGSVATQDIPAWEIWVGVPARFIKARVITQ